MTSRVKDYMLNCLQGLLNLLCFLTNIFICALIPAAQAEEKAGKGKTEEDSLKKQLEERSPVCRFRKPNTSAAK